MRQNLENKIKKSKKIRKRSYKKEKSGKILQLLVTILSMLQRRKKNGRTSVRLYVLTTIKKATTLISALS